MSLRLQEAPGPSVVMTDVVRRYSLPGGQTLTALAGVSLTIAGG